MDAVLEGHTTTAKSDRNDEIARRVASGTEPYRAIASDHGITVERVRQIAARAGTIEDHHRNRDRLQQEAAEQAAWDNLWDRMQTALDEDRRCRICGAWNLRSPNTTMCSPEHSRDWLLIRYQIGEDRPATRAQWVSSPDVRDALKRWRPDLLNELGGSEGNKPTRRKLNDEQRFTRSRLVKACLTEYGPLMRHEIQEHTGLNAHAVAGCLEWLSDRGVVHVVGWHDGYSRPIWGLKSDWPAFPSTAEQVHSYD